MENMFIRKPFDIAPLAPRHTPLAWFTLAAGLLFAGLVITMLPTLFVYLALQEQLTNGITAGAVKG